ncbi:MAG: hypothetical protein WBO16_01470 [Gammaproteobacteria bacterium]
MMYYAYELDNPSIDGSDEFGATLRTHRWYGAKLGGTDIRLALRPDISDYG